MATARTPLPTWKGYADLVALTLGVNVWVSLVLLPGLFTHTLHGSLPVALAVAPLVVLAVGVARRLEGVLLLGFPMALLAPLAVWPAMAASPVYGPVRFTVVALGVVGYLIAVAYFTTYHEPPPPVSVRTLSSAQGEAPARWRRRERVYWELFALSLLFPATLIGWVNFDRGIQLFLEKNYPGRVALMTTVLNVGAIVLWLGIYHGAFLGVLRPHRTGDRDLVVRLAQARADARGGRLRLRFYAGVAVGLVLMVVLLWTR